MQNFATTEMLHYSNWLHSFNDVIKNFVIKEHQPEIKRAIQKSIKNGVVAFGDISNTGITIKLLKNFKLGGVVFLEYFDGLGEEKKKLKPWFIRRWNKNRPDGFYVSLSPHALYSTSAKLIKKIFKLIIKVKVKLQFTGKSLVKKLNTLIFIKGPFMV